MALVFAERRNGRSIVALWLAFYAAVAVAIVVSVVTGFGHSLAAFASALNGLYALHSMRVREMEATGEYGREEREKTVETLLEIVFV